MSKEPIGTLVVVILKARNLNDKHSFYKQDVFATVSLNGKEKRTHVDVKGGQHPVWDAEVRFPVFKDEGSKHRKLEVACFAKEPRSDDLLGKGVVDITETLKTGEFDEWVPLDIDGVVRGDLYLEITYFSAIPPKDDVKPAVNASSLQRRPSKLSPAERLSRPVPLAASVHVPPPIAEERPQQPNIHARPYTEATKPAPIPDILRPAGPGKIHKPTTSQSPAPSDLPSILRPGNPNMLASSPPVQQNQGHRPPSQQVQPTGPSSYYQTQPHKVVDKNDRSTYPSYQQSYNSTAPNVQPPAAAATPNPYMQQPSGNLYDAVPPLGASLWSSEEPANGPLSFPVPTGPAVNHSVSSSYAPPPTSAFRPSSGSTAHTNPYAPTTPANPYANHPPLERYQSPLPLPNKARKQSPPSAPRRVSPSPDRARVDELRRVEEEAAKRKAQEENDLELALKLDRELNLMGDETTRSGNEPHIPGGW